MKLSIGSSFLVLLFVCIFAGSSLGAIVEYHDETSFMTAISGWDSSTLDFESLDAGDTIPDAGTVGGITFSYDLFGESMIVTDLYYTTSGYNSLGLTGGDDAFWDTDSFNISFADSCALGMYFITSDYVLEGEIQLITDAGTAYIDSAVYTVLGDGGIAYFLGLTSDTLFSSVTIGFGDTDINFVYNVDDITTASSVPVPASILLLGYGLLGIAGFRTKIRRRHG